MLQQVLYAGCVAVADIRRPFSREEGRRGDAARRGSALLGPGQELLERRQGRSVLLERCQLFLLGLAHRQRRAMARHAVVVRHRDGTLKRISGHGQYLSPPPAPIWAWRGGVKTCAPTERGARFWLRFGGNVRGARKAEKVRSMSGRSGGTANPDRNHRASISDGQAHRYGGVDACRTSAAMIRSFPARPHVWKRRKS